MISLCFLQVVVSGTLDYSDPKVQEDIEDLIQRLENTTYIDPLYTESWLRSFLDYVNLWKGYQDGPDLNVDDEQSFIRTLRDVSNTNFKSSLVKISECCMHYNKVDMDNMDISCTEARTPCGD